MRIIATMAVLCACATRMLAQPPAVALSDTSWSLVRFQGGDGKALTRGEATVNWSGAELTCRRR